MALSINLDRILKLPGISDVALEGLIALTTVLIASIVVIGPGPARRHTRTGLIVIGFVELAVIAWLLRRTLAIADPQFRTKRPQVALLSACPASSS